MLNTIIGTIRLYSFWTWFELAGLLRFGKEKSSRQITDKVGLLSYCLPPHFNSGTHRPLSFIKYCGENGWSIFGVTNPINGNVSYAGNELLSQVPEYTKIYYFDESPQKPSWRLTPKIDGGFHAAISITKSAIRYFKNEKPSIILASGPPFCYHVAGYFLSRMFGIPLILDYRDEWTLCPFDFTSKSLFDKWFEKRCVKHAELLIYTTKSHLESHKEKYRIPDNKQALIFNGWEESDIKNVTKNTSNKTSQEHIVISYVGRISGHTQPQPFIELLAEVVADSPALKNKITLNLVGEKSASYYAKLSNYANKELGFDLCLTNQVSKREAIKIMRDSDYLLMFCNKELATYIPGKLYDYLSCKRPVIAYGYPGEVSEIIESLDAGIFVKSGDKELLRKELVIKPRHGADTISLDNWLMGKTRRCQARNLFSLLLPYQVSKRNPEVR